MLVPGVASRSQDSLLTFLISLPFDRPFLRKANLKIMYLPDLVRLHRMIRQPNLIPPMYPPGIIHSGFFVVEFLLGARSPPGVTGPTGSIPRQ